MELPGDHVESAGEEFGKIGEGLLSEEDDAVPSDVTIPKDVGVGADVVNGSGITPRKKWKRLCVERDGSRVVEGSRGMDTGSSTHTEVKDDYLLHVSSYHRDSFSILLNFLKGSWMKTLLKL